MAVMTEGLEAPVKVYVRKGLDNDDRFLSFIVPEWLSQGEVLDKGWAIDGNQVLFAVSKKELLAAERDLVDWFRQKGHGITFC
jgi:hypothetical protein